jgi:GNAT superfamily N-acetyltransferase
MASTLVLRAPRPDDATALAVLADELGYPTEPDTLAQRLEGVAANDDAAVFVAAGADDLPLGWVHVELVRTLVAPLTAQIMGLVVADAARGRGIGAELLHRAEAWAADHGCRNMLVGTRVTRERAHRFYAREGYTVQKTSYFLARVLP